MAESQAKTAEIIKAMADLQATGIFPEDHGFMRKVAWHESRDGKLLGKSNDFVKNGGIWQIDPIGLEDVQKNLRQDTKAALIQKFGVDVDKVSREKGDLIDVRTGAAVARALMYRKPAKIPEDDDGQAAYWV
ncbi:hypothetical protein AAVH_22537 [Aphelenchoides avenae]|nr:hypothetical protein AAVH_22537 [Aphelenchus avenae]